MNLIKIKIFFPECSRTATCPRYLSSRIHALFHKQGIFFSWASVLLNFLMNWTSNIAYVLLIICRDHLTETLYILRICVIVYVCRSSHRVCFIKMLLLQISQYSQENTCTNGFFWRVGLFTSYSLDLFFITISTFFTINHIISLKQTQLFFEHFWSFFHWSFCLIFLPGVAYKSSVYSISRW